MALTFAHKAFIDIMPLLSTPISLYYEFLNYEEKICVFCFFFLYLHS